MTIDPATISAMVATIAAAISVTTYLLNRKLQPRTVVAKLLDRIYELDRLILQYPKVASAFVKESNRTEAFFYAPASLVPRDDLYFQLKAYVYYHINFCEEIYLAVQDPFVYRDMDGSVWLGYIKQRMRHRLLREVFDHEINRQFKGGFSQFICANAAELDKSCESDIW